MAILWCFRDRFAVMESDTLASSQSERSQETRPEAKPGTVRHQYDCGGFGFSETNPGPNCVVCDKPYADDIHFKGNEL